MMQVPPQYAMFPVIDASLNGTSAVLLLVGRGFIKRGRMAAHRALMIAALASSSIFLACYLYYHWHVGSVHFQGQGWSRPVYFSILISHTILAAAICTFSFLPSFSISAAVNSFGGWRPAIPPPLPIARSSGVSPRWLEALILPPLSARY